MLLLAVAAAWLWSPPAFADPWYEHYSKAERALVDEDWTLAVEEINEALEKKGDSGARVRSYGMKVTAYFPYLKLGIAYYHLGQYEAALQAFETERRLGAIADSDVASEELERYRELVGTALQAAALEQQERIRQIVEQGLGDAEDLAARGLLDEAIAAVDRVLAVAPDDTGAQAAMHHLRERLGESELARELQQRLTGLVAQGREAMDQVRYAEAASYFRQTLALRPDPDVQALLDQAQDALRSELETDRRIQDRRRAVTEALSTVRDLEAQGQILPALDQLQSVLALEPSNQVAMSIQVRLLEAQGAAEAAARTQAEIVRLLAEAEARLGEGMAEASLAAANRVLAFDPGNAEALGHVAQAYGMISRRLLGRGTAGNIPPAVRFVDLREEGGDGRLVQRTSDPEFRLSGVVIDNTPVEVVFQGAEDVPLETTLNVQPLGDYYLTEFALESTLPPGVSTFRLVATDAEALSSSSQYTVIYTQPYYLRLWFYGALAAAALAAGAVVLWWRSQRRRLLRTRRFNPYVAGAPVLEDEMFFGRRDLVDRILQTIHNNSLLLYGERRIGKTSIQHQLKKRLQGLDDPDYAFYPVYIDLQGTPEARFFSTIAEDIFHELGSVLGGLQPTAEFGGEYAYRDFVRDIHAVLKTLKLQTAKKVKLVLLIDEVDELNDYDPRINQKLRSLFMKSFAENLVSVVSGVEIKKQWEREGSPWYNFFEEIRVEALRPQEARELIERPIRAMFRMESGTTERIVSLTGGKPYLIQKLCIALVSRLHEEHRRRITIADVDAVGRPGES